jgi:acetyl esterase/lipase
MDGRGQPVDVGREAIVARVEEVAVEGPPEAMRPAFDRLVLGSKAPAFGAVDGPPAPPPGVRLTDEGGTLTAAPEGGSALPPVIWFHGGGYVFGSPRTHAGIALHLAARGLEVRMPAYPLAPEFVWPAQLDAALAALPAGRFVLAGDSAGGHLALVTALEIARGGRPAEALLLASPNTDRTGRSATRALMEEADPMVADADNERLAEMAFAGIPWGDRQVSPALDDLSLLPPTWIEVGRPEVLLGDAQLLAARAAGAGAAVHLEVTEGLLHMAQVWAPWWAEARASLDRMAAHVRAVCEATPAE